VTATNAWNRVASLHRYAKSSHQYYTLVSLKGCITHQLSAACPLV